MSDRPNNPNKQNNPPEGQTGGGWQQPNANAGGGWRVPQRTPTPEGEFQQPKTPPIETRTSGSWRVPTLPRDLEIQPEESGAWHRPKPEDTTFSDDDQSVVAPDQIDDALIPPGGEFITADASQAAPVIAQSEAPADEADEAVTVLPFDAEGELAAEVTAAQSLDYVDEDDDDESFSMSELIALASLVDNQKPQPTMPAPVAEAATDANDPAAYAREQLALLQAQQTNSTTGAFIEGATNAGEATSAEPAVTETDAAAYARQQLERLTESQRLATAIESGTAGTPLPTVAPIALTTSEQSLAQKYHAAEGQIRALRDQYRANVISRDQLQEQLKRFMVLDDQQRWWMMGIESEAWYRYENNQWMLGTPDVLAKEQVANPPAPAAPVRASTYQAAGSLSLPYLPDDLSPAQRDVPIEEGQTVPTSPIYTDNMPLPRQVPVRDPEATIPGTQGIYLGENNDPYAQPTVASDPYDALDAGQTMINPNTGGAVMPSIPAPLADQPPQYNVNARTPTYERAVDEQRASTFRTVGIAAAVIAALLFLGAAGAIVLGVVTYNNLAEPWQDEIIALANYQPTAQTARIFDAAGNEIAQLVSRSGGDRQQIDLENVSPDLIHAVISLENERYFEDPGFDPIAIGRAFIQNLTAGDIESGASTITQQIARNLVMRDSVQTADRKLQEIVIAAEIAQRYDKNFILELYLNEIFLGNQANGVEAAAQFYFDDSAADLTLPQAALVAGLIQAPATFDPVVNRDAAFQRIRVVMNRMAEVGCLQFQHAPYLGEPYCVTAQRVSSGPVAVDIARIEARDYLPRTFQVRYPHFVNYVQGYIENAFGSSEAIFRQGMQITTTINPSIQDYSEDVLAQGVNTIAGSTSVDTGAILVSNPTTGAILAMVGSPDFSNEQIAGQVNNVISWQQPGSAIKPILYTAALEGRGTGDYYTPATILWDVPVQYGTYAPVNFDGIFNGPTSLRLALQNSRNVPAVKTLEWLGIDRFRDTAGRMGIRFLDDAQFGLATALGANEARLYDMVQAYGTLANQGLRVSLYSITSIRDAAGNEIELPTRAAPEQVVVAPVAYLMQNILSDNDARASAFGTNSGLAFPAYAGRVAAKTGTSDGNRDLWTMGFSNNFVVGVWIGRHDDGNTINTTQTTAVPIWNAIMGAVLSGAPPAGFNPPTGVVQQQVCGDTGALFDATAQCRNPRNEIFTQSQPPPASGQAFVRDVSIDTWSQLRANQYCAESVITERFLALTDASAVTWLASTSEGRAYAQANTLPTRAAPTAECVINQTIPQIGLNSPTDGAVVTETVTINGTVLSADLSRYQIELALEGTNTFTTIAGPFNQQAQNGVLTQWDSRTVQNGTYILRLAVFSNQNGYLYRTVRIVVNNVPPTPTITPSPTVTPLPPLPTFAPFTPLPFPTDTFGAQVVPPVGGGVPTNTIIPIGGLSNTGPTPTPNFN